MKSTLAAALSATAIALLAPLEAQTPGVFPAIDVRVPEPPRPLIADGATHLVYELHIRNLSPRLTTIDRIEVRATSAASDAPMMLRLDGNALEAALFRPGAPDDLTSKRELQAGRTAIAFIWIRLQGTSLPATLTHRFDVRVANAAGQAAAKSAQQTSVAMTPISVSGVDVRILPKAPPVIGAPLEGDFWLAANGPDNGANHRRTLLALAGEARIAQRFATDWVRLFDDGRTFRGDPLRNESYRAFGARVLAVADGTVVETVDNIPENVPDPVARAVPITPATLGGNYIMLNLGDDAYAVYAHLQPGSLTVKKGDRVRRGQMLGLVGNTGNSTEPHLHFQMADRPRAFDAEGIPYALASFGLQAEPAQVTAAVREVGGSVGIDPAALAKWTVARIQRREKELPLLNAIVTFGDSQSLR